MTVSNTNAAKPTPRSWLGVIVRHAIDAAKLMGLKAEEIAEEIEAEIVKLKNEAVAEVEAVVDHGEGKQ
ncbi:MAG: hypothetical protein WCA78_00665 [Rhizomicrobium sp.]